LIVNEVMACGKPAIVSGQCGCAPDLIEEGTTGFAYPCGNIRALADAMKRFCQRAEENWGAVVRNKIKDYSMVRATDGLMKALKAVSS
jgi:glycosyltransferase involved in cell wall biosynthesis